MEKFSSRVPADSLAIRANGNPKIRHSLSYLLKIWRGVSAEWRN